MAGGLELPIGAPLDQLTKDLNGATQKIKQFENQTNTSLNKASISASKSTKSFTDFNRVIQDLPYGIIGISNNLQQLIPNIGLASVGINILLTAVTFAQTGFANWTRGINFSSKALDASKLSGDEYAATLDGINRAQLQGTQDAQKDLTTLNLLYKAYQNANLPLTQRKVAYEQLQKLYPDYFGNLKFEKEATEKTEAAYKKLSTAIIASARARAYSERIVENETKKLEEQNKLIGLRVAKVKVDQNVNQRQNIVAVDRTSEYAQNRLSDALNEQATIDKKIQTIKTAIGAQDAENLRLAKLINAEESKGALLTGSVGGSSGGGKATKDDKRPPLLPSLQLNKTALGRLGHQVAIDTQKALESAAGEIKAQPPVLGEVIVSTLATPFDIFKETLQYDILPGLAAGFTTFFDDILTKGKLSFENLGKAILSTFASVVASEAANSLVNLLGAKGSKAEGKGGLIPAIGGLFGKGGGGAAGILGTLLPVAGIALGAVGILGSLFKKKQTPMPAMATSVSSNSGVSSGIDIGGGRVVFEISGVNLIGVLNRAGASLARYKGG